MTQNEFINSDFIKKINDLLDNEGNKKEVAKKQENGGTLDESDAQQKNYISNLKKIQELYKKINYKYIDKEVIEGLYNQIKDKEINLKDIIFKLNLIVDVSVKSKEREEKEQLKSIRPKRNIYFSLLSFIFFFSIFAGLIYASYKKTDKIFQDQYVENTEIDNPENNNNNDANVEIKVKCDKNNPKVIVDTIHTKQEVSKKKNQDTTNYKKQNKKNNEKFRRVSNPLKYIYFLTLFVILGFIISLYQKITKLYDEKRKLDLLLNLSSSLDTKTIKHRIESYLKNKLRI